MTQKMAILLVEDDPNDQIFIMRALKIVDASMNVEVARDAERALDRLRGGARPKIIVTDLNMPGIGGRGLLETLKSSDEWRRIPTIVLSTSEQDSDVRDSYNRNANAYIVKPDSLDGYNRVAKLVNEFWLKQVAIAN